MSALAAGPLLIALIWEHLRTLKVVWVEITLLEEVTPAINVELASAVQEQRASSTPAFIALIGAAIELLPSHHLELVIGLALFPLVILFHGGSLH
jgi:hypothetical protein